MATTPHRYELDVAPEDREVAAALLLAAGARGVLERPTGVTAWFDGDDVQLPAQVGGGRLTPEPDRDWQAEWKATIRPVHAGRFAVVPTWLVDEHRPREGETTLVLDPGRAFGSGHHATTTLCLETLDELDLTGRTVADVGCGSGILAIAAAAHGARAAGSDLDADAIPVAAANAARNGVDVALGEGSTETVVRLLGAPADVVVANLVTDTVLALTDQLLAATAPGGMLVVSGIARARGQLVVDRLEEAGLRQVSRRDRDGWVALTGRREGATAVTSDPSSATLAP